MKCSNCSKDIPEGSQYCNFCGQKQLSDMKEHEQASEATQEIADKPVSKGKLFLLLGIVVIIIAAIIILPIIKTNQKYDEAVLEAQQGNHYEAVSIFSEIMEKKKDDIQDFVEDFTIELCDANQFHDASLWILYAKDKRLISNAQYTELDRSVEYKEADDMAESGNYMDAYYRYISLEDYQDSADKAAEIWEANKAILYDLAVSKYESGTIQDYRAAQNQFLKLGDYEDSDIYLSNIEYLLTVSGTYEDYKGNRYIIRGTNYIVTSTNVEHDLQLVTFKDKYCLYKDGTAYLKTTRNRLVAYDAEITENGEALIEPQETYEWDFLSKISDDTSPLRAPAIGMTADEVILSTWGNPKEINKSTYSWGTSEQWVYSGYRYIYLDDGIVTSIQE